MAVKIRLRAQGSVKKIKYRVVVADGRSPRDGKYIEALGWYDPLAKEDMQVQIKPDRLQYWISKGAQATDKVEFLMRKAAPGVLVNLRTQREAQRVKEAKKRRAKA
jgi:small subunit ribosomal protein S16